MKMLIFTLLTFTFVSISSEDIRVATCLNKETLKSVEISMVQSGDSLVTYLKEEGDEGFLGVMLDTRIRKNNSKEVYAKDPVSGFYDSHGKWRINRKTGEGNFYYRDVCWDWGYCGTTQVNVDLIQCVVDYHHE